MLRALGFVLLRIFSLHCAFPRRRHRLAAGAHDGRGDVIEGVLGLGGTYKYLRDVFCTFCRLSAKITFFSSRVTWKFLDCVGKVDSKCDCLICSCALHCSSGSHEFLGDNRPKFLGNDRILILFVSNIQFCCPFSKLTSIPLSRLSEEIRTSYRTSASR